MSIQGIEIAPEPIATGHRLVREKEWRPGADIYVVGWSYSLGSPHSELELMLLHGETVLFYGPRGGSVTQIPAFVDAGLGYRLQANEPLTPPGDDQHRFPRQHAGRAGAQLFRAGGGELRVTLRITRCEWDRQSCAVARRDGGVSRRRCLICSPTAGRPNQGRLSPRLHAGPQTDGYGP